MLQWTGEGEAQEEDDPIEETSDEDEEGGEVKEGAGGAGSGESCVWDDLTAGHRKWLDGEAENYDRKNIKPVTKRFQRVHNYYCRQGSHEALGKVSIEPGLGEGRS